MKLFIKLLLGILVLGLIAPFYLKRPDGQPWMQFSTLLSTPVSLWNDLKGTLHSSLRWLQSDTDEREFFGKTKVYRWQDKSGAWHLSDTPPPTADAAEIIWVDPDSNLIQGMAPEEMQKPVLSESENVDSVPSSSTPIGVPLPLSIDPSQVVELKRRAEEIKQQLEQRNNALADPSL